MERGEVLEVIQGMSDMQVQNPMPEIYNSALKYFQSWDDALKAAKASSYKCKCGEKGVGFLPPPCKCG